MAALFRSFLCVVLLSLVEADVRPIDVVLASVDSSIRYEDGTLTGSPGYIDLSDLTFSATGGGEADSVIDIAVFRLPDECDSSDDGCDWTELGVGKSLPYDDGTLRWCCNNDAIDLGLCQKDPDYGRLIIDANKFSGDHRFIRVPAKGEMHSQLRYGKILQLEEGHFVVVFANCNESGREVQVTGDADWYPTAPPNPFEEAAPQFLMDAGAILESCGIDPDAIEEQFGSMTEDSEIMSYVSDYFDEIRKECSDQESETFNSALDEFQACAGFDLRQFIEDLPSAVVGTFLECVITTDWSSVTDLTDPTDVAVNLDISEKCLNFEYGHNAFGDASRQVALYPDRVLPCFTVLSERVPACSIDSWPMPLIGDWLKPAACLMGKLSSITDDVLKIEMGIWDSCFPADGGCENECAKSGSLFVHSGYGLPVSDAMERIANSENGKYKEAFGRYETYLSECTEIWSGWTDSDDEQVPEDTESFSVQKSEEGSAEAAKQGYSWLTFVAGLAVGVLLFQLALVVQAKRRRRAERYNAVELTDLNLDPSEPVDSTRPIE